MNPPRAAIRDRYRYARPPCAVVYGTPVVYSMHAMVYEAAATAVTNMSPFMPFSSDFGDRMTAQHLD